MLWEVIWFVHSRDKAGLVIFRESQRNWIIPVTRRDTDNHFGVRCCATVRDRWQNRRVPVILPYTTALHANCKPEFGRNCDSIQNYNCFAVHFIFISLTYEHPLCVILDGSVWVTTTTTTTTCRCGPIRNSIPMRYDYVPLLYQDVSNGTYHQSQYPHQQQPPHPYRMRRTIFVRSLLVVPMTVVV